jgi:NhaA family Na+:H+ antiporter
LKATLLFKSFFESEKAGGLVLLFCAIVSLYLTNSSFIPSYGTVWHNEIAGHSIEFWINDGLMTFFFLLIGLELKREWVEGELSNIKDTFLPLFGAVGGMVLPAFLFFVCNYKSSTSSGFGIPMATDIAFAIGILSLLGNRVPLALKVFLTALAVIDDLGAIVIIALFYTKTLHLVYVFWAFVVFLGLLGLHKFNKSSLVFTAIGGFLMWYFMLHSGIHATIAGILLAFSIPLNKKRSNELAHKLQMNLHIPVAFYVVPLFALCNTAIAIDKHWTSIFYENYSLGIMIGLCVGKPLGIISFAFLSIKLKLSKLPSNVQWNDLFGVAFLGGIGFTMSIFITILAFQDMVIVNNAKFVIVVASLISGIIGYLLLRNTKARTASFKDNF